MGVALFNVGGVPRIHLFSIRFGPFVALGAGASLRVRAVTGDRWVQGPRRSGLALSRLL